MATRKFNGLYYDKKYDSNVKYKAVDKAESYRKQGYNARVIKTEGSIPLYEVFVSRRKN
jgi:hypothetical protein